MLYFNAHLNDGPPDESKEIRLLRRPDTILGLTNITSKVLMKDPVFFSAITHAFADIMTNFFFGVGEAMKVATPEVAPETNEDVDAAVEKSEPDPTLPKNILPFRPRRKFMPEVGREL